jgi:hypothetical protein
MKKQLDTLLPSYNLSSTVNFPTRVQNSSVTAIDNIFIDVSTHDNYSIFSLCNGLSDHEAQLIVLSDVKVNAKAVSFKNRTQRIDQTAVQDFQYQLSYEMWDTVFSANDINIMFNSLLNTFLRLFYSSFPLKEVKIKSKNNSWMSSGIRNSFKHKRDLYILCCNSTNVTLKMHYRQ